MSCDNMNWSWIQFKLFSLSSVLNDDDVLICWCTRALRPVTRLGCLQKGASVTNGQKKEYMCECKYMGSPAGCGPARRPTQPSCSATCNCMALWTRHQWTPLGAPWGSYPPWAVVPATINLIPRWESTHWPSLLGEWEELVLIHCALHL